MKSIKALAGLSWLCQAGIIILTGVQTRSVNLKMVLFMAIVPTLINLPIVLPVKVRVERTIRQSMVLISLLAYFFLLILMIIFPGKYLGVVQIGIGFLSLVGLVASIVLLKFANEEKSVNKSN